jgi:hypothetical protein
MQPSEILAGRSAVHKQKKPKPEGSGCPVGVCPDKIEILNPTAQQA